MAFTKEVFEELKAVVGARNISDDIGIRESYRNVAAQSSAHYGPFDHWTPCPQAVVLPGSTEEVQEIARICNQKRDSVQGFQYILLNYGLYRIRLRDTVGHAENAKDRNRSEESDRDG